nr:MAG TPA: hypothetical protein [Caudoviricetes sp.]
MKYMSVLVRAISLQYQYLLRLRTLVHHSLQAVLPSGTFPRESMTLKTYIQTYNL